jgi:hypothetical protein
MFIYYLNVFKNIARESRPSQQNKCSFSTSSYSKRQSSCPLSSKQRLHKGAHTIVFRTICSKIELSCPRLFHCQCQPHPIRSFSSLAGLLLERTAPELLYFEATFASLVFEVIVGKSLWPPARPGVVNWRD